MTTRAIYSAITIPGTQAPYDRASLKIYYPAQFTDSDIERNTGLVDCDSTQAPFPVVIMLAGINLGSEGYGWLAKALATKGIVTVTFTLVAEEMPGYVSLTPGLDLGALAPNAYGTRPSATAVAPILDKLVELNASGVLAGQLNLDKIILGGHSAGGSVAMMNARPDWFPGLCAAFSYGAHGAAATALGWEEDAMFALPTHLPLLIIGGTQDGCIANSGARYGSSAHSGATARIERTFAEGINRAQHDSYLALIEGANHFSLAYPKDETTGRPFIDLPTTQPDEDIRSLLLDLIGHFIDASLDRDPSAREALEQLLSEDNPLIAASGCK